MPTPSPNARAGHGTLYERYPELRPIRELVDPGVRVLDYAPGETLFARGAPVRHLYFLLSGAVREHGLRRLADGAMQQRLLRTITPTPHQPMPVLGMYDYLYRQSHSTHGVAAGACEVLVMDEPTFEKVLYLQPELPYALAPLAVFERLRTTPLLSRLDRVELHYVAEGVTRQHHPPQASIFRDGADAFYLIDRGQVEVRQVDGNVAWLGNGATFGLPAVDAQAHATSNVELFCIRHAELSDLAPLDHATWAANLRDAVQATLGQLYVFSDPAFTPAVLARLAGYVSHYVIPVNTVLAQQGELSDSMWVLMPGHRAQIHALDEHGLALIPTAAQGPNYFGEAALYAQTVVEATLEAEAGNQWLRLHRADFQNFLRVNDYRLLDKLKMRGEVQLLVGDVEAGERYPWLQDGEGVIWPVRRHWLVLVQKTWFAQLLLGLILLGFVGVSLLPGWRWLAGTFLSVAGLFAVGLFLWGLYDYWNDYIVVTTRRLVRQEHVLLQSQQLHEAGLEQIRNVDVSRTFAGRMLGYGRLAVQTFGAQGTIAFDFVPDVEQVQEVLNGQMNRRRHHRESANKMEIQRHLEGRLGRSLDLPERVDTGPPLAGPAAAQAAGVWRQWVQRQRNRPLRYEEDVVVWRKHWLVLVAHLFWPVATLWMLLFLLFGELVFLPAMLLGWLTAPVSLVLGLLMLANLAVIAWRVADWHNDTYVVTRDEVADIEKLPLFFDEQRRTARLVNIDNIRSEIPSTFHYLFNVGNVRLETAAVQGEFTFDMVGDPSGVAAEIRRRIDTARRREEEVRARQRARELTDWFELYDRLKQQPAP